MKKTIFAVTFAAAVCVPGMVSAATLFEGEAYAIPLNGTVPAGFTGTSATCELVNDNVKLGVSKNVVGGFACDEVNNLVQVASCHSGGSRAVGVACNSDADLNTPNTTELPPGCADTTGNSTQPSFKAFTLSSAGGVMNEAPLSGRCTSSTLSGIKWVK
jgi:hypothetical protein